MDHSLRLAILDPDADVRLGRKMVITSRPNLEIVLDSTGQESDVSAVAEGLVDVLVIDQRLAIGPGISFYQRLRDEMGIKQAPECVVTTAFEQPALFLTALEAGISHVVAIEHGPEALLEAIDQAGDGYSKVSLELVHSLLSSQSLTSKLDLELMRLVEKLPEKLASNLRRLRSVWNKANPNQLRDFSLTNLDGLVARLPVRTAPELIIRLLRSGLLDVE
jgi:DNA-binding NarL/FixJ family response regulator